MVHFNTVINLSQCNEQLYREKYCINQKALFADIGKAMVTSRAEQKCLLSQGCFLKIVIYNKWLNYLK